MRGRAWVLLTRVSRTRTPDGAPRDDAARTLARPFERWPDERARDSRTAAARQERTRARLRSRDHSASRSLRLPSVVRGRRAAEEQRRPPTGWPTAGGSRTPVAATAASACRPRNLREPRRHPASVGCSTTTPPHCRRPTRRRAGGGRTVPSAPQRHDPRPAGRRSGRSGADRPGPRRRTRRFAGTADAPRGLSGDPPPRVSLGLCL